MSKTVNQFLFIAKEVDNKLNDCIKMLIPIKLVHAHKISQEFLDAVKHKVESNNFQLFEESEEESYYSSNSSDLSESDLILNNEVSELRRIKKVTAVKEGSENISSSKISSNIEKNTPWSLYQNTPEMIKDSRDETRYLHSTDSEGYINLGYTDDFIIDIINDGGYSDQSVNSTVSYFIEFMIGSNLF